MDKKIILSLLCALIAIFVIPSVILAASFDCAKAPSEIEKLICSNADISKLDDSLSSAYKAFLKTSSEPERIRREQKSWLKKRDTCRDVECLRSTYQSRLSELAGWELNADDSAKGIDCSNPVDQKSIGICQAMKAEKAEKEMKIVYQKVVNTMQGGCKELFETYQKAWEQYIAAKCLFDNCSYGSMFGQMVGICEEENYRKRIEELKQMGRTNKE